MIGTSPTNQRNNDQDMPDISVRTAPDPESSMGKIIIVVKGKSNKSKAWSETAEVTSLSSSGVGFFMTRSCEAGQLVSLIMPMPIHLRRYDRDKRFYRIWGLVQHCYQANGDEAGFHIGVALIGKEPPASYGLRPDGCYRISGTAPNGLWKVEDLERKFMKRSGVRYWNSIEASLLKLNDDLDPTAAENSVTENISESGASVFSDLRVSVGDRIKFQTSSPRFSSLCIVRHRRIGDDDRTRIHLQFIDNSFPVFEIEAPIEGDEDH
jgi:hypothetical protein